MMEEAESPAAPETNVPEVTDAAAEESAPSTPAKPSSPSLGPNSSNPSATTTNIPKDTGSSPSPGGKAAAVVAAAMAMAEAPTPTSDSPAAPAPPIQLQIPPGATATPEPGSDDATERQGQPATATATATASTPVSPASTTTTTAAPAAAPGLVTPNTESEARARMRGKEVERDGHSPAKSAAEALSAATVGGSGLLKSVDSFFGWGMGAVTRSLEAAESAAMSAVSTLTPLDARADGALSVVLTTIDRPAVNGVRVALERVFGLSASLRAVHTATPSAAQIVGVAAARATIAATLETLTLEAGDVAFATCPFVEQGGLDGWVGATLMVLHDPETTETVEAISQAVPVPAAAIDAMHAATAADYPHKATGLAVTVEAALKAADWTSTVCGISTEQLLTFSATVVLGRYRRRLAELQKQREAKTEAEAQPEEGADK